MNAHAIMRLDPHVAKDEALNTEYYPKDSINMMLVTCVRLLNMKIEELP